MMDIEVTSPRRESVIYSIPRAGASGSLHRENRENAGGTEADNGLSNDDFSRIWECYNQLRKEGQLFDAALLVGGEQILVHRSILAAHSDYFRALFTNGMKESNQREVELNGTGADTIRAVIDYIYTRKIELTPSNVWDVTVQADLLLIHGLLGRCSTFICSQLSPENCVRYMKTATFHNITTVYQSARDYILRHFTRVSQSSLDFLSLLELKDLDDLISDDSLNVTSEEITWEAIVRWIDYAYAKRANCTAHLLRRMRLGLLSTEYFITQISSNPAIMNNTDPELSAFMSSVWNQYFCVVANMGHSLNSLSNPLLRPRIPREVLFVIGGWSGGSPVSYIETYDGRAMRWYSHPMLEDITPRAYHGVVVLEELIYILGGFDGTQYYNSVKRFDPVAATWSAVGSMYTQRCYVSAAVTGGLIYACGGFDGRNRLSSVERFDVKTNQWTMLQPMNERRSDASAASLRGILYIAGGFDGESCLSSVESYNPVTAQWTRLPHMSSPRSGVSLIAFKGLFYALGGFDGDRRLDTGERYCPLSRKWEPVANMLAKRSNFAVADLDDRIYAVGGFNGTSTIPHVEYYDADRNVWCQTTDMNVNRSALKACVLDRLPNMKQYTYYGHQGDGGDMEEEGPGSEENGIIIPFGVGMSYASTAALAAPPGPGVSPSLGNNADNGVEVGEEPMWRD